MLRFSLRWSFSHGTRSAVFQSWPMGGIAGGQRAAGAVDFAQQVGHETGSGRRYLFGLRSGWILTAMLESSLTGAARAIDVTGSDEHEH